MTKDEALKLALEALENNRQTHHYCEDTWYSCPKHEDGCANDSEGDKCICGADEANAEIDKAITALRQALEQQPADEPVAWMWYVNNGAGYVSRGIGFHQTDIPFAKHTPLYTRPQPAAWVDLTDEEILEASRDHYNPHQRAEVSFARAIEAKLKEKNQ